MFDKVKRKFRKYFLNRSKHGTVWKLSTTVITLVILISLYSKGVIAIATINNRPVTMNELIEFLRRDNEENIINQAITERIILLAAKKRNVQVTAQETQQEIERLTQVAAENGQTIYELMQTAEEDSATLEKNVKLRMTLYQVVGSGEPITEEEIEKYVEANSELYKEDEKEIIQAELESLLLDEDISADYDSWIKDAKANTDVDYIIDLDNL